MVQGKTVGGVVWWTIYTLLSILLHFSMVHIVKVLIAYVVKGKYEGEWSEVAINAILIVVLHFSIEIYSDLSRIRLVVAHKRM